MKGKTLKSLLWVTFALFMLSCTAYAACAVGYFTYRMNFPPGASRYHLQEISLDGNLTITLPGGFSFISSTSAYSQSGNSYTWAGSSLRNINYTIQSPDNCTEGTVYKSAIYENNIFIDEFIYACVYDDTVVDYKVEYGHGCGNYLDADEPYISSEPATLFNLVRVWNIGHYLDPDEDAHNASITCNYESYPVRTYGRVDVGYESSYITGSYFWDLIYGGYWFRIGVLSQDVSGKSIGDFYGVNCTELSYDFEHERVVAPFPNYTLEVRSTSPLILNSTAYGSKAIITLKNIEKYPIYGLVIDFIVNGYVETNHLPVLNPGETVTYYGDPGENVTVSFIPSWQKNCFAPVYYRQILSNVTNISANSCPAAINIPSQAWAKNTSNDNAFDLDDYFTDQDNDTLAYSSTAPSNITVTINSTTNVVSFNQPENYTGIDYVVFSADDGYCKSYSNNVTLVVYPASVNIIGNATGNATNITIIEVVGGGGGRQKVYVYVPVNVTVDEEKECREIWVCSEWSECFPESFRSRDCYDANQCGTKFYKPLDVEGCLAYELPPSVEEPLEIPPFEEVQACRVCILLPFMLILILIILIILSLPGRDEGRMEERRIKDESHLSWRRQESRREIKRHLK